MNTVTYDEWLGWNTPPRKVDEAHQKIAALSQRADCQELIRSLLEIVRHSRFEEFNALASGAIRQARTWDAALLALEKLLDSHVHKQSKG